ncbi:transporter [Streptomyces avermitilis]|uniref:transporter n=1 Tax=Streptomyces avermitilis TaxID=33903 RepID=UPI0033C093BD
MIWLTWRQLRTQTAVVFGAVVVLAILLAATGPHLADLYDTAGDDLVNRVSGAERSVYYGGLAAVLALPAVIGMFWGAPLITRELEAGTHRLAWNQTVTRTRWLVTKLGLAVLAAMTAAGLAGLAVTWWSGPIDRSAAGGEADSASVFFPRIDPVVFGGRGVVPIGCAAFAFMLGVTLGVIVRRTLPAMAATLAVFAAVQVAMPLWVRPHLADSVDVTLPFTQARPRSISLDAVSAVDFGRPGAWVLSEQTVNASGRAVGLPASFSDCTSLSDCTAVLVKAGYRQRVIYQPADHFWALQWAEAGIFLGLAVALAGVCVWRIRRVA